MPGPRAMFIADIVVEHLEEIEFLWCQRQAALRSARVTDRELSELDERLEAHVQGALVAGDGLSSVTAEGLASDDAATAFASAYALLRLGAPDALKRVVNAFEGAEGDGLDGLSEALCHAGPANALAALRSKDDNPPALAAAIELVTAFRQPQERESKTLDRLLQHSEPAVRRTAWRAASYRQVPRSAGLYEGGLKEADPKVRGEALQAAAWGKHAGLLAFLRSVPPTPEQYDALALLAVLGKPEDLKLLMAAARAASLGPRRLSLLGMFGHPEGMDVLLREMRNPDPATAAAAGAAFMKITGKSVETDQRAPVPPADGDQADEFATEFPDEANVPDANAAQAQWEQVKGNYAAPGRYAAGKPADGVAPAALPVELSMESRWEACLRARYEGQWQGGLVDVLAFPYRLHQAPGAKGG